MRSRLAQGSKLRQIDAAFPLDRHYNDESSVLHSYLVRSLGPLGVLFWEYPSILFEAHPDGKQVISYFPCDVSPTMTPW